MSEKHYYYSRDDHHNRPYISGPETEESLKTRIGGLVEDWDEFWKDLQEWGERGDDYGDTWRLHTPEELEVEARSLLAQAHIMRKGGELPDDVAEAALGKYTTAEVKDE